MTLFISISVAFCFVLILICFQVHGMISTVAVLSYSFVKGWTILFVQLLLPLHHHQRVGVWKTGSSLITRCSMKCQYIVFLKEQYEKKSLNQFFNCSRVSSYHKLCSIHVYEKTLKLQILKQKLQPLLGSQQLWGRYWDIQEENFILQQLYMREVAHQKTLAKMSVLI